jgi:hypothetical protein
VDLLIKKTGLGCCPLRSTNDRFESHRAESAALRVSPNGLCNDTFFATHNSYALATAISFSRVTTGAHFPSDVFIGAATGFAMAHFDVLRH